VEVGGGQHAIEAGRDQMRDQWLCGQGFLVLRFWNTEVLDNIDGVAERIRETLAEIEGRNDR
jgi:crossover junction endodeoxyribonuclease RuvC